MIIADHCDVDPRLAEFDWKKASDESPFRPTASWGPGDASCMMHDELADVLSDAKSRDSPAI